MSASRAGVRILGIAGPSAGAKTTLARGVQAALGAVPTVLISHDDYYRDRADLPLAERAAQNFDHPDALETDLLIAQLARLRAGEAVDKPLYDFVTHARRPHGETVGPAPVIIVEGILALALPALRECFDLRVYVETPPDICLARRVLRDVRERGRTLEAVVEQYLRFVRPMQEQWVLPSREFADLAVSHEEIGSAASEIARRLLH